MSSMHTELGNRSEQQLAALDRLAELASGFGVERAASDARLIAERASEGRFYVVCVGQFKRGKSTLLDALIGQRILPTGVVPVTSVPTVVRYGNRIEARIRTRSSQWATIPPEDVERYVSEEYNSQNVKNIEAVEIFVPSPLLAGGMCLVDTPGLGSVFASNTQATRDFIPHIDAAIIVIGADPPISGEEISLIEDVARQVSDLIFVLNKADRTTEEEKTIASAFCRSIVEERLQKTIGPIFEVSAIEQLGSIGPGRDWSEFVGTLQQLATESGASLSRAAVEREIYRMADRLINVISEEREALLRPLGESEKRISSMRQLLAQAEKSLGDLGYLFTAEQNRLSRLFTARRDSYLGIALPLAQQQLMQTLPALPRRGGPGFRRTAMDEARTIARTLVLPWLESEQAEAENSYRHVAKRFIELANEFLQRLEGLGVAELPETQDYKEQFQAGSKFYFTDLLHIAHPASPFRFLSDLLLGIVGGYKYIVRDVTKFLNHMIQVNSARIEGDLNERVLESRRRLETEIRLTMQESAVIAERAMIHARSAQSIGISAVRDTLHRLSKLDSELKTIRSTTGAIPV